MLTNSDPARSQGLLVRLAFVSIPCFPCVVEVQHRPELACGPLIVGDDEQPKRVFDCSLSASAQGVRHGMTIRQALGRCPDAVIIPPDPVLYRTTWESILAALGEVSPEVEDERLGRAYVNIGGIESHYFDDDALAAQLIETVSGASGLDARVGMASGKFPATAAATTCRPRESRILPAGSERQFLAPLTTQMLPLDTGVLSRLKLLGLERVGDIAELTVPELMGQFGFEGKRIWQLANGIDDEPLRPQKLPDTLTATALLESAVAGIDVMIAITGQLLSRLKPSLAGRAAREFTLQAELESGRGWEHRLVFREPVSEDARLAFLLRTALTNSPPPQAIRSLSLRLSNLAGESGKQLSLGQKQRQQRHLEEAIRQLKTRYGYSPVYRCVEVEAWSAVPEDRRILVESDA
jgi:nucleotidyltransferase/DNA polymerase involved in DNA repair